MLLQIDKILDISFHISHLKATKRKEYRTSTFLVKDYSGIFATTQHGVDLELVI